MTPADRNFRHATVALIVLPVAYTFGSMIVINQEFQLTQKIAIGVTYLLLALLSLRALFKCSLTDPGVIPSVKLLGTIPELTYKCLDTQREYFVDYKTREQQEDSLLKCTSDT